MAEENKLEQETGGSSELSKYIKGLNLVALAVGTITIYSAVGDKGNQKETEEVYQEHKQEGLDSFYSHVGKDSTMSASEFIDLYQQMENPKYQEWREMKGGKR